MRQIGALPLFFYDDGTVEVVLVTSRFGRRWIIPKGNPMAGLPPTTVAALEALEEGGIIGTVIDYKIGTFKLESRTKKCVVDVYPLIARKQLSHWDEAGDRRSIRCDLQTAQSLVSSPSLAALLRSIKPVTIKRFHREHYPA